MARPLLPVKRPEAVIALALNPLEISKEPAKVLEPVELPVKVPVKTSFPFTVRLPPIEADWVNSNGEEIDTPPVKVQRPEIVWLADLEAGPLVQSNLRVPLEAVLEKLNMPAS
jgi:hypothetical protein